MGQRLTAVSLFAGAAGMDCGLEQAGIHVAAANDFDRDCCETLNLNQSLHHQVEGASMGRFHLGGTRILHAPVQELGAADLWVGKGNPTLLVGGPPCQPFSSAGSQRGLDDPRGLLFQHFVRLAGELQPCFILFENVRGLITQRGTNGMPGEALNMVREAFERIGYATSFRLIRAADHGLPQRRVRLFMFGARERAMPEWPKPTHANWVRRDEPSLGILKPWVALREFLESQPPLAEDEVTRPSPALEQQLRLLEPGRGLKSPGRPEATRPGGHWGYKQGTFLADPDLPARTVTAAATQDWVREKDGALRRLALRECARLQGFPTGWKFAGSKASQFRQVGNAVPPPIARMLGEAVAAAAAVEGSPTSEDFPHEFHAAISYTHRDGERNRADRVRLARPT